jgi:hypothetical protein
MTIPEQSALQSLVSVLKTRTEHYLGDTATNIMLTFPGFFNDTQKLLLYHAPEGAFIRSIACSGTESSANAATLAQRHGQFLYNHPNSTSTTECISGPFGIEEVISVDYTGSVLAFHMFDLHDGRQTSFQKHKEYFVALKNSSTTFSNAQAAEDQSLLFWENVKSSIRSLVVQHRFIRRRILRLVVSGTASHDQELLEALRSAAGELLPPSPNQPYAVRVVLSEEELERNHKEEDQRTKGLSCHYDNHSPEQALKDHEDDLLALIDPPEDQGAKEIGIDPTFAPARGAALLGLASRILSCEQRGRLLGCPWCTYMADDSKVGRHLHFPGWDEYQDQVSGEHTRS